jgi:hypothetical protein
MKEYYIELHELWNVPGDGKEKVFLASEVDEVIMNMVSEFAETAKDYESEQVRDKEEIARLKHAICPDDSVTDIEALEEIAQELNWAEEKLIERQSAQEALVEKK